MEDLDNLNARARAGIIRLPIKDAIPALELGKLLQLLTELYLHHLWLDEVERTRRRPLQVWSAAEEDTLQIARLEIGSPDIMELLGRLDAIVAVAAEIGKLFAGGLVTINLLERGRRLVKGIDIHRRLEEIRLIAAQARLTEAQADKEKAEAARHRAETRQINARDPQLDIVKRSEALARHGLVRPDELQYKGRVQHSLTEYSKYLGPPDVVALPE